MYIAYRVKCSEEHIGECFIAYCSELCTTVNDHNIICKRTYVACFYLHYSTHIHLDDIREICGCIIVWRDTGQESMYEPITQKRTISLSGNEVCETSILQSIYLSSTCILYISERNGKIQVCCSPKCAQTWWCMCGHALLFPFRCKRQKATEWWLFLPRDTLICTLVYNVGYLEQYNSRSQKVT